MNEKLSLSWGLQPPETATGAWGARAIYKQPDGIDLLWDRQSTAGEADALVEWLNTIGLKRLRQELRARCLPASSEVVVEIHDGAYTIVASPKGSYGYLYIGAWKEAQ